MITDFVWNNKKPKIIKGNYEQGVDAYNKFLTGNFWNNFLKAFLKAQVVHV